MRGRAGLDKRGVTAAAETCARVPFHEMMDRAVPSLSLFSLVCKPVFALSGGRDCN
jgi:hypothetical protein